jgi:predicted enzyme related to lactoylglutathione lyase
MESNPVRWFEIYVQDIGRAKSFYESVFQLKLEKRQQGNLWAHQQRGQRHGALAHSAGRAR